MHWRYFLALETDFAASSRYVEFSSDNLQTYSIELLRLLLSAGAECDVVLKLICANYGTLPARPNIADYAAIMSQKFPQMHAIQVSMPRFQQVCHPWSSWNPTGKVTTPIWWTAYNNAKHHRDVHFKAANLDNTFHAMSALFVLTLTQHAIAGTLQKEWSTPELLQVKTMPGVLATNGYGLSEITSALP